MEKHYFIRWFISLWAGTLQLYHSDVQTALKYQYPGNSTCAVTHIKTCNDPLSQVLWTYTDLQRNTQTPRHHTHPQHNRHSSHWRNIRGPPWGMTPHWKHPASHTKAHTSFIMIYRVWNLLPLSSNLKSRFIKKQKSEASVNTHAIPSLLLLKYCSLSPSCPPFLTLFTHFICCSYTVAAVSFFSVI